MATTKGMAMVCMLLVLLASTTGSFAIGFQGSPSVLPLPPVVLVYVNDLSSNVTVSITPPLLTPTNVPAHSTVSSTVTQEQILSGNLVITVLGAANVTYSTAGAETQAGRRLALFGVQVTIDPAPCPAGDGLLIRVRPDLPGLGVVPVESDICLPEQSK